MAATKFARTVIASTAALVAVGASLGAFPLSAQAATTAPVPAWRVGLYGVQDPTYDGAYRQGLSLLALHTAGATPAPTAVTWLLDQQCSNGGWQSVRTDLSVACVTSDANTFAGPDSNSTALAIEGLAAVGGHASAVTKGIDYLKTFQNSDGGFSLYLGAGSDANSTGLAVGAFAAAGFDPTTVTSGGHDAFDALQTMQLTCSAAAADRGSLGYQGPDAANSMATVQGLLGLTKSTLAVAPSTPADDAPAMTCPSATLTITQSADAAAGWVARRIDSGPGFVPSDYGSGPDWGTTAQAIVALVASGHGLSQAQSALASLQTNLSAFTVDSNGDDLPAALAYTIFAVHSMGGDVTAFSAHAKGAAVAPLAASNLVTRLEATITKASGASTPTATPTTSSSASPAATSATDASGSTLPDTGGLSEGDIAGIAAVVFLLVGGAFLLIARGRKEP
jgi:hypothetical protein